MPPVGLTAQQVGQDQETLGLFHCSNDGCIRIYQSYAALEKHLSFEKFDLREERAPLLDRAKTLYHHKLLEGARPIISLEDRSGEASATSSLTRGWALKTTKSSRRFTEAQRNYLGEKFQIGQHTGHKLDPTVVARDMRYAKKSDGTRLFQPDDFLTATQVQSYFLRQAAALRHHHDADSDDERASREEQEYSCTRQMVVQQIGLAHPVTYDHLNLCDMVRLNKLSVRMLRDICAFFEVETVRSTAHRKAPYIAVLEAMIRECSCHGQDL